MTRLYPGDVYATTPAWVAANAAYSDNLWDDPVTIVGAALQVSDDDDATYADIFHDHSAYPTPLLAPSVTADFPATTADVTSTVTCSIRAQWLDPDPDGNYQMYVWLFDRTDSSFTAFSPNYGLHDPGFGPLLGHDYSDGAIFTATESMYLESTFWDALAAGNVSAIAFINSGIATVNGRVFELWLNIEAAVVTGRRPHTRIHPRDDNRGPSPRIFPPPQSQQTIGRISGYL